MSCWKVHGKVISSTMVETDAPPVARTLKPKRSKSFWIVVHCLYMDKLVQVA